MEPEPSTSASAAFAIAFAKQPPLQAMDAQGQETRAADVPDSMDMSYMKLIEQAEQDPAAAAVRAPGFGKSLHKIVLCLLSASLPGKSLTQCFS